MKAFTKKNDGFPSDPVINTTDVAGPSEPRWLNLTCKSLDTIRIEWERPATYYNSVDYYYIYITGEDLSDNITIPASRNITYIVRTRFYYEWKLTFVESAMLIVSFFVVARKQRLFCLSQHEC